MIHSVNIFKNGNTFELKGATSKTYLFFNRLKTNNYTRLFKVQTGSKFKPADTVCKIVDINNTCIIHFTRTDVAHNMWN